MEQGDAVVGGGSLHRLDKVGNMSSGAGGVALQRAIDTRERGETDRCLPDRRVCAPRLDGFPNRRIEKCRARQCHCLAMGFDAASVDRFRSGITGPGEAGQLDGAGHGRADGDELSRLVTRTDKVDEPRGNSRRHGCIAALRQHIVHGVHCVEGTAVASLTGE